ncbi:VPLPA-CTERM sorting domain-containing protein [Roseibium sp. HPY-6]|uniref:VPLPA-CTERM sorting domain-containing protein n=1 Tax=Roseibium sp. HPY-6 TaxID=3229852 RepID=UPI00338D556B
MTNPAHAVTYDFEFSFVNKDVHGGGTVTGIVRGLTEGRSSQTSVEVLTNSDNFGINSYSFPFISIWDVKNGEITFVDFVSRSDNLNDLVSGCCVLHFFIFPDTGDAEGILRDESVPSGSGEGDFGLRFTPVPLTPVPLPASGLLLMAALAGAVGHRRWKQAHS